MKKLITILFFFICTNTFATNYYVSNLGNDAFNGLSTLTPWRSLGKASAAFINFAVGDSLLFRCGDTFFGTLVINKSGVANIPIIVASYGTGNKPIISGLVTLDGWTNTSGNLWQCTPDSTIKANCNVFTINGEPYAVGRTPNSGYLIYQSSTTTNLVSSTIPASLTGAEIVIRKSAFVIQRGRITSQAGTTVNYTKTENLEPVNSYGPINGIAGYGYFLQRYAGSLDAQNEWYTNGTTMQMYSTVNPNSLTIKASYKDTLVNIGSRTNITFYNLKLEGAGRYSIYAKDGNNIWVKNCDFDNNTLPIGYHNVSGAVVDGCTLTNNFNAGIYIYNSRTIKIDITNNVIDKTGLLLGMEPFYSNANGHGVFAYGDSTVGAANHLNIIGNTVLRTSYDGIRYLGSNVTVRRNIIDTFCVNLDDGGGIYSYLSSVINDPARPKYKNIIVDSNFVSNTTGAGAGAGNFSQGVGIYYDNEASNSITEYNTVWNVTGDKPHGFQTSDAINLIFRFNTFYNCGVAVNMNKGKSTVSNLVFHRNILYQKLTTQLNFRHTNNALQAAPGTITIGQSLTNLFDMDSNWITNQNTAGYNYYYRNNDTAAYQFPPNLTLSQWQNTYLQDQHSTLPPVTVTNTNTAIYTNPSYTPLVVNFAGFKKIDPKGAVYNNAALVPAWSSLILIDNGTTSNTSPTANAGADHVLTSPANSTSLIGSGTDADGTISTYAWTLISGPNTPTFGTANASSTTVNNLIVGTYQIQLMVTDNGGATGTDIVLITVNAAANVNPVARAGSDQTITLPVNSATLSGTTSTDADGTINAYLWTHISGPGGSTIASPNSATTVVNSLTQGIHVYQLMVTDNSGGTNTDIVQVTVNPANVAPTANAGIDQSITLPVTTTTLTGSGTDADGTISAYLWTKISGPTGGNITSSTSATTGITALQQGTYVFQLRVTDNSGATGTDFIQVVVNPAVVPPNNPPTADAGIDQSKTLPTSTATLVGSGADTDGSITGYLWRKISGPSGGAITSNTSATTGITGLTAGVYIFQLRVTDNSGDTATDAMQITVNAANIPPVARAGSNQTITLPTSSVNLSGTTSTDADGTISSYAWTQTSGPSAGVFGTPNASTTTFGSLVAGVYQVRLQVVDNSGDSSTATVQITVIAANINPTAGAGANQTIQSPASSVDLSGSGSDPDGTISSYAWVQLSGPNTGSFGTSTAQNTTFNGLIEGTYQVQLTVTDNDGGTGTDIVQITVSPPNQNPVANAGANRTITMPTSSLTLTGSGIDADGTISSYHWTGPEGSIISPNSASTVVSGLTTIGVHTYTLTVTDNDGGTAQDTMTVTVLAEPVSQLLKMLIKVIP